jgi:hypothetical protein
VPLGLSLQRIAREAVTTTQVRAALSGASGKNARITQLDIDFQSTPLTIRAVLIVPRQQATPTAKLNQAIAARLHQPVDLQVDQVLIDPASKVGRDPCRRGPRAGTANRPATCRADRRHGSAGGRLPPKMCCSIATGSARRLRPSPSMAQLATYQALESRITASAGGWTIAIVPPVGLPLTPVSPALDDKGELSPAALEAIRLDAGRPDAGTGRNWRCPALPATAPPILHPSSAPPWPWRKPWRPRAGRQSSGQ